MRIGLPTDVARVGTNETVTGLWAFANALGLLTDIITERTGGAGVTVDGLLIRDAGVPEAAITAHEAALAILESQIVDGTLLARLAAAEVVTGGWRFSSSVDMNATLEMTNFGSPSNATFRSDVVGDAVDRFALHVGGVMQWGDGALARDTNLFRSGPDTLRTDDDFVVGGSLNPLGNLHLTSRDISLFTDVDDLATGTVPVQRIDVDIARSISGFAGGLADRIIWVINIDPVLNIDLLHQNAGSVAANRMICPAGALFRLDGGSATQLWYDITTARWRVIAEV